MTETAARPEQIGHAVSDSGPCDWRRALDSGWAIYDAEADDVLAQGLPDTIRALSAILDDIDSRLGLLEYTLRTLGIPPPPGGIPDDEGDRYWALYTLLRARETVPRTCACGG